MSEFISFITSEASERCHQEKRKTINGEDILFAMSTLGFDMYVEPLKLYLQKFREVILCARVFVCLCVRERVKRNNMDDVVRFSVFWLFFQAMKGEKGIPGVSVGDSLAEELTDDSFSKNSGFHTFIYSCLC